MTAEVTIDDVRSAAARISPFTHRTPVVTSATLDRELGAEVFFKCENLQKVGAFKARGATNTVLSLDDAEAEAGVVTHSSGNHGAALAYAAAIREVPCTVVMPHEAPKVKVDAVRNYGARVEFCAQHEREETCAGVQRETGGVIVHPFDDRRVIAGQGTAALELLEEVPDLDVILAPIGGGGLLSGTAVVAQAIDPRIRIVGAEPAEVDDAHRSLLTGIRQPRVEHPNTIADGLLTGIGAIAFSILTALGAEIVTVTEAAIVDAALFHLLRMKLVVEPSGAVALAGVRRIAGELGGRRIGVIISGGNTDFRWMPPAAPQAS